MNTEEYIVRSLSAQRSDVISGLIPEISASVGEDKINNDDNNPTQYRNWATAGFFGRINYSYKERYLFEANLRYDGSSRFLRDSAGTSSRHSLSDGTWHTNHSLLR